eukprot:3325084-Amphidinium_carterae.1
MRSAQRRAALAMKTPRGVWNQQRAALCMTQMTELARGTVDIGKGEGVVNLGQAKSLYKGKRR